MLISSIRAHPLAYVLGIVLGLGAAQFAMTAWRSAHEPQCPATSRAMVRIELVFGMSRHGRPDVDDTEWAQFLEREVTPRFPDGLTVLAAQGQWRNQDSAVVREPSRVLLVWAKRASDLGLKIEQIREAWKRAQVQESVLKAESTDCVAF